MNPDRGAPPGRRTAEGLLNEPPLRAIVRLAMPTTMVMLFAATSNVLFTYYVSRLGSEAIAAVSLVFPISLLAITAMVGGVGAGAASAVARALGGFRQQDAIAVAEHALMLSVAVGAVFGAVIVLGAPFFFRLMGGTGNVLEGATLFARILFAGAAITFCGAMFDSIMRGEGNVRVPAACSSASLVLQIVLAPVFMFVFGWGLAGAAAAMLTSQLVATAARARYVFGGHGQVRPSLPPARPTLAPLLEILRVGIPASLGNIVNYVGLMVLTGIVARFGSGHLAAYGLGTRLDFLLLSLVYGFGAAILTLVGLAAGARRPERFTVYVVRAGAIMVALLLVPAGAVCWNPGLWLRWFTEDQAVLDVGWRYFRIVGPSYPFLGVSMVVALALQGLGRAAAPMAVMGLRVAGVLGTALLSTYWLGLDERAVFATIASGNVLAAGAMSVLFVRTRRHILANTTTAPPGTASMPPTVFAGD
jgi:putative MATE family efflux protein